MSKLMCILVLCAMISNGAPKHFPFQPCTISSPHFNQCLLEEAQRFLPIFIKGFPDLGVPSCDPLKVGGLSLKQSGLETDLSNMVLTGYDNTVLHNFTLNWSAMTGHLSYNNKYLKSYGNYAASGVVLRIPIKGSGISIMTFYNLDSVIDFNFVINKHANGKDYMKITNHTLKYYVRDNAHYDISNLFKDKLLSASFNSIINENWRFLLDELAPPAFNTIISKILSVINKFLAVVPIDQLFKF